MKRIRMGVLGVALFAITAVGCGAPERGEDPAVRTDTLIVSADQEIRSHFEAFRREASATLDELRSDMDQMREELGAEFDEWMADVTVRLQETQQEVQADLARLESVTVSEAEDIRRRASERLSESEAELAEGEVRAARDPEEVAVRTEERLEDLEATLDSLDARIQGLSAGVAEEPEQPMEENEEAIAPDDHVAVDRAGSDLDPAEVAALRAELNELRARAFQLRAEVDEDWEDTRDSLADELAELTRDVRRQWYAAKWDREHA